MRKTKRDERVIHRCEIGEGVGNIDRKQKRVKSSKTERERERERERKIKGW